MSFWGKIKDVIGVDDEYYEDDFYDDYYDDDLENDQESNSDDISEDIDENKEDSDSEHKYRKEDRPFKRNNVVSLRGSKNIQMKVSIREPLTYEDGKVILDDIMEGKTVVLNLEMLEVDKKTQIFYFVSGGVYSLDGSIQNVTKDIYVLAPKDVEIDGSLKEQIANRALYQL